MLYQSDVIRTAAYLLSYLATLRAANARVHFHTEPSFNPVAFNVYTITNNASLLYPGYIFFAPVHDAPSFGLGGFQSAPQIRQVDGTLVWYGEDNSGVEDAGPEPIVKKERLQDFHACQYFEEKPPTHLCYSDRRHGFEKHKIVLDNTYRRVASFKQGFRDDESEDFPNMHEFNIVDEGRRYLQVAWPKKSADLSGMAGPADGHIYDGCFQEVDIETEETTFDWCWMDQFPIWETQVTPNVPGNTVTSPIIGNGSDVDPFDAWHINSVDKNSEGDYLISSRHDDQVLKIAGNNNVHGVKPGTALWRLGGYGSTITLDSNLLKFSKQHDARFLSTTGSETVFSVLDNAWEGYLEPTSNASSAMIISVNNETDSATLIQRYIAPLQEIGPNQGTVQVLPNDNIFVSWGSSGAFSEFSRDGQLLLHVSFSSNRTDEDGDPLYNFSYRLSKSAWTGKPEATPSLVAYSKDCELDTPLMAYVSWNGATEVAHWQFHVSNERHGPWIPITTVPRTGFETQVSLSEESNILGTILKLPRYVSVTALDERLNPLPPGVAVVETFVPKKSIRNKACDERGCYKDDDKQGFSYAPRRSCIGNCGQWITLQVIVLVVLGVFLEFAVGCYESAVWYEGHGYTILPNNS